MSDEFDPFAGETGLKANYEGEITDAFFQSADFGLRLNLKVVDIATGEEDEKFYSCGPDWGSYDGGETCEHPKGDKKGFNNQTAIFELISSAFSSGAEEELRRRSREQFDGKGPKAAGIWKGLRFYWEAKTEEKSYIDKDDGNKRKTREVTRILPTKFLGVGDGAVATGGTTSPATSASPAPTGAPASTPSPAAPASSTPSLAEMGLPDDQVVQIKVKAKTTTYGEWVDFVMALPDTINNGTLMAAIGEESFYTGLKES